MDSESLFDLYLATKKLAMEKQVDIAAKFEELCKSLLEHNDINTFEKIISKIVNDGHMINVSGVTCKLDATSIKLCDKMFILFSEDNTKHPIDYSDNEDILKFMENFKNNRIPSIVTPKIAHRKTDRTIPFTISLKDFMM